MCIAEKDSDDAINERGIINTFRTQCCRVMARAQQKNFRIFEIDHPHYYTCSASLEARALMPLYGGEPGFGKQKQQATHHENKWSGAWNKRKNKELDEVLRSNKKALHRSIKFVPAKKRENGSIDPSNTDPDFTNTVSVDVQVKVSQDDDSFPIVDHPLYPVSRIKRLMAWSGIRKIGPGLLNSGNTCFCNSVLQCLAYTPPLANYCLSKEHSKRCQKANITQANGVFDAFSALEQHIQLTFASNKSAIRPSGPIRCDCTICSARLGLIRPARAQGSLPVCGKSARTSGWGGRRTRTSSRAS